MKFSKSWLQDYIVEILPEDSVIEDALNKKAFEVESIEIVDLTAGVDTIFDIKVLPNRHGDALSHYYMAKEIAAILNLKSKLYKKEKVEIISLNEIDSDNNEIIDQERKSINNNKEKIINIEIENEEACKVFEVVKIEGVDNRPSPEWLRDRVESIGQKPINAIVDVTNYVQYTMNKPLHSYDESNVSGGFIIRMAKAGEKLLTLDKKELELDVKTLIIADSEKPLGLAGIKGGMYSGVNENTKVILLESANFDPVLIRQTSKKYNIRTDASKRFESGQSNVLVHDGIEMAVAMYREIFDNEIVVSVAYRAESKKYNNIKINEAIEVFKIELTRDDIIQALGFEYKDKDIRNAIEAYGFKYEFQDSIITNKYIIIIPPERIDLKIKEDIIDEIGRMLGYDTLIPLLPNLNRIGHYNDSLHLEMRIREYMSGIGYDEVMNYTLRGDDALLGSDSISLESTGAPISLRTNISDGLIESFHRNLSNAPLMHLNIIRIYEIGSVFSSLSMVIAETSKENEEIIDKNKSLAEHRHLAITCDDNKKKTNYKNELDFLIKGLASSLGMDEIKYDFKSDKPATAEINLTKLNKTLKHNNDLLKYSNDIINLRIEHSKEFKYQHLSIYPIITRDISVYYEMGHSVESLLKIIENIAYASNGQGINETLVRTIYVVDSFERTIDDGTIKRSAAFRIVYQADDRTLTDEEINLEADKVYQALKMVGCELR